MDFKAKLLGKVNFQHGQFLRYYNKFILVHFQEVLTFLQIN